MKMTQEAVTQEVVELLGTIGQIEGFDHVYVRSMKALFKILGSVTSLDLRHNYIGNAGAEALAEVLQYNTTLTHLDLRDNQISDRGAAALATAIIDNTTLTDLDLWANNIGDDGAVAFADVLGYLANTTLKSLDLSSNLIGVRGADVFANAIRNNTSLTYLGLVNNQFGDIGEAALNKVLDENPNLQSIFTN